MLSHPAGASRAAAPAFLSRRAVDDGGTKDVTWIRPDGERDDRRATGGTPKPPRARHADRRRRDGRDRRARAPDHGRHAAADREQCGRPTSRSACRTLAAAAASGPSWSNTARSELTRARREDTASSSLPYSLVLLRYGRDRRIAVERMADEPIRRIGLTPRLRRDNADRDDDCRAAARLPRSASATAGLRRGTAPEPTMPPRTRSARLRAEGGGIATRIACSARTAAPVAAQRRRSCA